MNGILLIDKPSGWTSFDVIAKLRGALKTRKMGHGGTLDPMATGVLPVLIGKATRIADLLPDATKRYSAEMILGITTDTYDTEGEVLRRISANISDEELFRAADKFRGDIMQIPPMYSAVKIGGRKLYDLARQGKEIERPARPIRIDNLEVSRDGDKVLLDITCSKGTYIRSICHDIGELLGCGAAMSALRRTASAGFGIEDCISLDCALEFAQKGEIEQRLLKMGAAFSSYPRIDLDDNISRLMLSGVRIDIARLRAEHGRDYSVYHNGDFLGIGRSDDNFNFIFKNLHV